MKKNSNFKFRKKKKKHRTPKNGIKRPMRTTPAQDIVIGRLKIPAPTMLFNILNTDPLNVACGPFGEKMLKSWIFQFFFFLKTYLMEQ